MRMTHHRKQRGAVFGGALATVLLLSAASYPAAEARPYCGVSGEASDGEASWLLCNDASLAPLLAEAERLEVLLPRETRASPDAPDVPDARRSIATAAIEVCGPGGGLRTCLRDVLALRIASVRAALPPDRRGNGKVSIGPLALACPSLGGARTATYVNTPVPVLVLDGPQGRVVLNPLMTASGERYGVWRADGELALHGKNGAYSLMLPGKRRTECTMGDEELP